MLSISFFRPFVCSIAGLLLLLVFNNSLILFDEAFSQRLNTFYTEGIISSLLFEEGDSIPIDNNSTDDKLGSIISTTNPNLETPYILSGIWTLNVDKGKVQNLNITFTMQKIGNLSEKHTHEISNFRQLENKYIQLNLEGTVLIFGKSDIKTDNLLEWKDAETLVILDQYKTFKIILDPETSGNHFSVKPIYGTTEYFSDTKNKEKLNKILSVTDSEKSNLSATTISIKPNKTIKNPDETGSQFKVFINKIENCYDGKDNNDDGFIDIKDIQCTHLLGKVSNPVQRVENLAAPRNDNR